MGERYRQSQVVDPEVSDCLSCPYNQITGEEGRLLVPEGEDCLDARTLIGDTYALTIDDIPCGLAAAAVREAVLTQ